MYLSVDTIQFKMLDFDHGSVFRVGSGIGWSNAGDNCMDSIKQEGDIFTSARYFGEGCLCCIL